MIGEPLPLLMPPGINNDVTQYMAGMSWWDGNLIRWNDKGVLEPVGGWQKLYDLTGSTYPVREIFSWSDNGSDYYVAFGTLDKAIIRDIATSTEYDATPTGLTSTPSGATGYGSGSYGTGRYGLDSSNNSGGGSDNKFDIGYWTFDNWGEDLIAVHSNDGRLLQWSPSTPTSDFAAVANAPVNNRLCITTDERHVMVMGGASSPRRIKWCSREDITLWTAAADNSAGGFELDTSGIIIGAIKVPQGILVATDVDIHLVEYIGPPDYYSRRLITDETGIISPKAMAPLPNGCILVGQFNFWNFNGGVSKLQCSVSNYVFKQGNLNQPLACFMGVNEAAQEVWFFFPEAGETEANRYVNYKYADNDKWWSKGELTRTAWLNPVWTSRPLAVNNLAVYEHERGWTDNGSDRTVYAETGAFELSNGGTNVGVSRIFHDTLLPIDYVSGDPLPYEVEFNLARSPQGTPRTYGPVTLNVTKGYTTLKFKTRQLSMKITETIAQQWGLGKTRLVVKSVGGNKAWQGK